MSANINLTVLLGRVGSEPDHKVTANNNSVCKFSMATSHHTGTGDARKEVTTWHRIVCFGKTADNVQRYVHKGDEVSVRGSIRVDEWTDKTGAKRQTTEIHCDEVQFVLLRRDNQSGESRKPDRDDGASRGSDDPGF